MAGNSRGRTHGLPRSGLCYFIRSVEPPRTRARLGVPADGEIDVAALVIDGVKRTEPPLMLPPPLLIAMKDQVWHSVSNAISH